jgi:alcohol dehydrogenase class IV
VLAAVAGLLDLTSLPRTLQAIGVDEREIDALADQTRRAHLLLPNNPVDISPSTARGLYELAFDGEVYCGQF